MSANRARHRRGTGFDNEIGGSSGFASRPRLGQFHFDAEKALRRPLSVWRSFGDELDRWSDAGKTATFWWRDDDAVAPTPQLERLFQCAQSVPIALAVIPRDVTRELVERLQDLSSVMVLQHGWSHVTHENGGLNEYPASRSEFEVSRELALGRNLLNEFFGAQAMPVFVPPYHGFDDRFLPLLLFNGITAISRKGPRLSRTTAGKLLQVNAHIAPIQWTVPPFFGEDEDYLTTIIDHLQGKRAERYDPAEPTGLLTHHLVQNERSYDFIARLIDAVSAHGAAEWLHPSDVFRRDCRDRAAAP
jgi:hypothetical protein